MAKFTNLQLVKWCEMMVEIGAVYNYGTTTAKCSNELLAAKTKQYPAHYTQSRMPRYRKDIAEGKVCCDCVGMIKGFFWTNNDIEGVRGYALKTGGDFTNKYASNGFPDVSAEGCYDFCKANSPKKFSNNINSLPEVPGVLVFAKGHVGVYVGNGYAIEARGFAYGVVKTRVAARNWNRWAYLPDSIMDYISEGEEHVYVQEQYSLGSRVLKKGMEGSDVKELQERLIKLGYNLGNSGADGEFGSKTLAAVKGLQERYRINVDGIVGEQTLTALGKALAKLDAITKTDSGECSLGERTLKKGMSGDDVKELQEALIKLGYDLPKYGADGDYGNETVTAVKLFQMNNDLEIDGIFGAKSLAKLKELL